MIEPMCHSKLTLSITMARITYNEFGYSIPPYSALAEVGEHDDNGAELQVGSEEVDQVEEPIL
jgi:hypothetical protein